MSQSEFEFEDVRDMRLLSKIDARVRKHVKAVEILEKEELENSEESIW